MWIFQGSCSAVAPPASARAGGCHYGSACSLTSNELMAAGCGPVRRTVPAPASCTSVRAVAYARSSLLGLCGSSILDRSRTSIESGTTVGSRRASVRIISFSVLGGHLVQQQHHHHRLLQPHPGPSGLPVDLPVEPSMTTARGGRVNAVLDGLRRFYQQTGKAPVTTIIWDQLAANHDRRRQKWRRRFPSSYAVLRYFPSFRAAWEAAGVQLANRRQAPWASSEDWYLNEAIGALPTATIALDLGRSESAIYRRIRHLHRHITDAWGWPLQRVARLTGVSEQTLRGYIRRGELPVFKGAKCVYIDPGDLPVVDEIVWIQPHPDLDPSVLPSLRARLVHILAGRDSRPTRPHRIVPAANKPSSGRIQQAPRSPRPSWITPGMRVCTSGPTAAMPQWTSRIGVVERVYWSGNARQDGPAQWRARVVFPRAYRKALGATVAYCLPVSALQPVELLKCG